MEVVKLKDFCMFYHSQSLLIAFSFDEFFDFDD
jgi:hypothetical protein